MTATTTPENRYTKPENDPGLPTCCPHSTRLHVNWHPTPLPSLPTRPRRRIVTSGAPFIDIDAFAAAHAYAELLRLQGHNALAASSSSLNASVTAEIQGWPAVSLSPYVPCPDDAFIVVDISNPQQLDPLVRSGAIVEVIDHHVGFEDYWAQQPAVATDIEFIGACCTQIFERWAADDLLERLSLPAARLMLAAIIDNTLNLLSDITTDRDRRAYTALCARAHLADNWAMHYFLTMQAAIEQDVPRALQLDLKHITHARLPAWFAQLAVWDAEDFLERRRKHCVQTMCALGPEWVVNLISIKHQRSYLLCSEGTETVQRLAGVDVLHGLAVADRLWLRKQFVKQALAAEAQLSV